MPLAKSQNITQPSGQKFSKICGETQYGVIVINIQKLERGEFLLGFLYFGRTVYGRGGLKQLL